MRWKTPALVLFSFTTGLVVMFVVQSPPEITLLQRIMTRESRLSMRSQGGQEEVGLRYGQVIRGTKHKILYNSVPKCGSRTFKSSSIKIFKKNGIQVTVDTLRSPASFENVKNYEASYVKNLVAKAAPPSYFQGHGVFMPFDKKPRPVYINFIRDPVSRMVSAFFFTRNGDNRPNMTVIQASEFNKTIEECILDGMDMCTKPGKYPETFCGFDPKCRSNLTWALEQAKSNIDKYYTYIGITEEYEASLKVLERLMPDMYGGAVDVYYSLLNTTSSIEWSKTKNKKALSQALNNTATRLLAVDYELYKYIYDKHRALKLKFNII